MVPANDVQSDFSVGSLKVNLLSRRVSIRGQEVHLTLIEYRLLSVLVKHVGKTLTHRQLLHDVWGSARRPRPLLAHLHAAVTPQARRGAGPHGPVKELVVGENGSNTLVQKRSAILVSHNRNLESP